MDKLKVGDIVSCKVQDGRIVELDKTYYEIQNFAIIGVVEGGYYLFVPQYLSIKNSVIATNYSLKHLGIDLKYIEEEIIHIDETMVLSVEQEQDGMICKICRDFFRYAQANQVDGTLICFCCRQNPYK